MMPLPEPTPTPKPKPLYTARARILGILALAGTAGAMYNVITSDTFSGTMKPLVGGGVLLAGVLVIVAGAHFSDGRHRK